MTQLPLVVTTSAETNRYRADIDGLRAIAVLAVVLFHAGLGMPGGYVGVDVFFVISGYLITSHIVRDLSAGTFSLAHFYERRCRRIVPASAVLTLATLAAGAWLLLPLDLEWLGRSAVAHAACIANIFFYRQSTEYFAADAGTLPLLHMWSLAVEEQFYFALPLFLLACRRLLGQQFARYLPLLLLLGATGSFVTSVLQLNTQPSAAFFLLPARAWELLVGSLLATLTMPRLPRGVRELLSACGLAAILVAAFTFDEKTPFPGAAALLPCFGAAALIAANSERDDEIQTVAAPTAVGRLLSLRPVVFVGLISYSLYLWHWPVLVLTKAWAVTPLSLGVRLALVAVMVLLAVASWRWIELPFRRRRIASSRTWIFSLTAGSAAAVAVIGGVLHWTAGLPKRLPAVVAAFEETRRDQSIFARLRDTNPNEDRLPAIGSEASNDEVRILLWGDSHAAAAVPALEAFCTTNGIAGRVSARASTPPLLDFVADPARGLGLRTPTYNRQVLEFIRRHKIKNVMLAGFWQRDIARDERAFAAAMTRTIAALRDMDVHVYVLMQVPTYRQNVPAALAMETWRGHSIVGWRQTFADHQTAQSAMYRLAKRLSSPDVTFIDPARRFVVKGSDNLLVADRGRSLYHDDNHVSRWGAKRVLGPLLNQALAKLSPATQPGL